MPFKYLCDKNILSEGRRLYLRVGFIRESFVLLRLQSSEVVKC